MSNDPELGNMQLAKSYMQALDCAYSHCVIVIVTIKHIQKVKNLPSFGLLDMASIL